MPSLGQLSPTSTSGAGSQTSAWPAFSLLDCLVKRCLVCFLVSGVELVDGNPQGVSQVLIVVATFQTLAKTGATRTHIGRRAFGGYLRRAFRGVHLGNYLVRRRIWGGFLSVDCAIGNHAKNNRYSQHANR
jgi:hypothetical protein